MGEASELFSISVSLLAGYLFIRLSYYRHFMSERLRSDRYALHLLGYSFLFFVAGEVIAVSIPDWMPDILKRLVLPVSASLETAGIKAPVINAIFLGLLLGYGDNLRVRWVMRKSRSLDAATGFRGELRMAAVARYVLKSQDAALRAIFRATILRKPLMVTLKSHKVYVGKPYTNWDDPTQALTYIKIFPTRSGYRDAATKKVHLSTRYDKLREELVELKDGGKRADPTNVLGSDILGLMDKDGKAVVARVDIEDLGIVIAWHEVESLTIYDQNLFDAFQQHESDPAKA